MYRTMFEGYQQLQQEMASVAVEWQECEKRIDDYVDEQVRMAEGGEQFCDTGLNHYGSRCLLTCFLATF